MPMDIGNQPKADAAPQGPQPQANQGGGGGGLIGGIIGGVTGAIGMLGQKRREKRAMENQKQLMDIQFKNQKELNQQGKDLAYQQWLDTNYAPQVEQMEKAGVNVGLMYGGTGAGGTTQTGSGGSASSGNAPAPQPMNIESIANSALTMAQIENIKANTEKTKVDTAKTAGADTTSVLTGIEKAKAETQGVLTQNEINALSKEDQIDYYKWIANKTLAQSEREATASGIEKTTQNARIEEIIGQSKLPELQANEINGRINNMLELARQGREKINIETFAKELMAEYPSITSVMGKGANELTMWLQKQLAKVVGEENASNYRKVK